MKLGNRPLTAVEVGGLVTIVSLIVACCLGVTAMSLFGPAPAPYQPLPSVSTSAR